MTTIEEYTKSILNIIENIDTSFIAFRGNAHDVDPRYNGPFMSYDFIMSEKQWVLNNIKFKAPIEFEIILHRDEYLTCQSDFDTIGKQYLKDEFDEMEGLDNFGLPVLITIDYKF